MISVKSGDPDQIDDDHLIYKDKNRSTDRVQDPISIQDDVHSFRMQYSIPGQNPDYSWGWKKAKWWENVCFKAFISFNHFNET